MSFVAVDLGASGSRYVSDSGQISVVPNNMILLPNMNTSNIIAETTEVESCLEVKIEQLSRVHAETEESVVKGVFPANVLIGLMAEKHRDVNSRPTMLMHKHVQPINYISAVVACALSKIKYNLTNELDLYIAVPPIEVGDARKLFGEILCGSYRVTLPKYMGGTVVEFKIESVECYEEALMASTSFFFNMNGTPKESNKSLIASTVLSLDIGASTSDIAIIKNGRYMDKSGQTYKTGGNEALDFLIEAIRDKYAIDLPIEDAERTMQEGRIQMGNTYDDVSDIVTEAKKSLARKLVSYLPGYFKRINIPINTINAVMTSGGGSLQSQHINKDGEVVKTAEPMSHFVTEELKQWCKGVDVVEYGEDARFANIKGLFIRAKMMSITKAKQKAAEVQAAAQTVVV